MLFIPSNKSIIIVSIIVIISIIYSTSNIIKHQILWNTTIISDNTNYDRYHNDENNQLLTICKKKSQIYAMSFISQLVLLYGIFVNYISCIKKTPFTTVILYISLVFYMFIIVIIFGIIKYNHCLEYYKDNTGTHIFYKLLMTQYISCTTIFSVLAFDYITFVIIKHYKKIQQIRRHNNNNNNNHNDNLSDDIMINEI